MADRLFAVDTFNSDHLLLLDVLSKYFGTSFRMVDSPAGPTWMEAMLESGHEVSIQTYRTLANDSPGYMVGIYTPGDPEAVGWASTPNACDAQGLITLVREAISSAKEESRDA